MQPVLMCEWSVRPPHTFQKGVIFISMCDCNNLQNGLVCNFIFSVLWHLFFLFETAPENFLNPNSGRHAARFQIITLFLQAWKELVLLKDPGYYLGNVLPTRLHVIFKVYPLQLSKPVKCWLSGQENLYFQVFLIIVFEWRSKEKLSVSSRNIWCVSHLYAWRTSNTPKTENVGLCWTSVKIKRENKNVMIIKEF